MIPETTIKISMLPEGVAITKEQKGTADEGFDVPPPPEEVLGISEEGFDVLPPPEEVEGVAEQEFFIPPPPEEEVPILGEDISEVPEAPSSE